MGVRFPSPALAPYGATAGMGGLPIRRHPGEPVPRASREVPTPGRAQAASQAPHGAHGISGARGYPEPRRPRAWPYRCWWGGGLRSRSARPRRGSPHAAPRSGPRRCRLGGSGPDPPRRTSMSRPGCRSRRGNRRVGASVKGGTDRDTGRFGLPLASGRSPSHEVGGHLGESRRRPERGFRLARELSAPESWPGTRRPKRYP
jgi:hypothetical protein